MGQTWFLYILKCSDDSLYAGVTIDVARRLERHNLGQGAKYTRSRRPCDLVYVEEQKSERDALKREIEIKGWARKEKLALVNGFPSSELERFLRISGQ